MQKNAFPSWFPPMRASLSDQPFSSKEWIFEPKLDGQRCMAFRDGNKIELWSANEQPINIQYPEIVKALASQRAKQCVLDGEIVAFDGERSSFPKMQLRMHLHDPALVKASKVPIFYYVFDLLFLDGKDLRGIPLLERKRLLKQKIRFQKPLVFMTHLDEKGEEYYGEACRKGWEGLIAKRAESRYISGRSRDWLKLKCVLEQEFVIGGYSDPEGARSGFGAILVGVYEGDRLHYAGKVGTGFNQEMLDRMSERLKSIEISRSPFTDADIPRRGVHWVEPKLVAQLGFAEWTPENKLRQGRFLGLRDDKPPRDVVRERPIR